MATYILIPSSLTNTDGYSIMNPSNAYTTTKSNTYANAPCGSSTGKSWLSGFDFSIIPNDEIVTSIIVRYKGMTYGGHGAVRLRNSINGDYLSSACNISKSFYGDTETPDIYTLNLTSDIKTIMNYSTTLGILLYLSTTLYGDSESHRVYGAEIVVETADSYKIIPSSFTYSGTVTDPENACTDVDSHTYAYRSGSGDLFLDFSFNNIETEILQKVVGIAVRIKMSHRSTIGTTTATFRSNPSSSATALSETVSFPVGTSSAGYTTVTKELPLTKSVNYILDEIESSGGNSLHIHIYTNQSVYIYGAEIILIFPQINKVVYDNETILDLTTDTISSSTVLKDEWFFSSDGKIGFGTVNTEILTKTISTTEKSAIAITISNLDVEPSWFILVVGSRKASSNSNYVTNIMYDGTTTYVSYNNGTNTNILRKNTSSYVSFTYSNGSLVINVKNSLIIGVADWEFYYY